MSELLLHISGLKTHFRTDDQGVVKAVDGVSLRLHKGEVLGLVGESGSGKSVLSLSILQLIQKPAGFHPSGSILFEGEELLKASPKALRALRGNRISMIFQDPMTSLNPFLTVERQLTEVVELHQNKTRSQARADAIHMLDRVGIPEPDKRVDQYPHEFSGGMRQRVMIAMALLCKPRLLLADEPTTALDVTIQAQILELIKELVHELGTSVVLVTHDLGVVAGMADRIAVMYAGRIVEESDTQPLFEDPRHPYTKGLLRSVPSISATRDKLVPIEGLPPDVSSLPPGCPFAPRCEQVKEACTEAYPEIVQLNARRWTACWDEVSS